MIIIIIIIENIYLLLILGLTLRRKGRTSGKLKIVKPRSAKFSHV